MDRDRLRLRIVARFCRFNPGVVSSSESSVYKSSFSGRISMASSLVDK
jgi:hypothetical protein